jgi:cellobiose phosphorylase
MTNGKAYGGLAARNRRGPLWRFTEANDGAFVLPDPQYVSDLYFPLCNLAGMKASVTPDFKGDICADFRSYLTIPTDIEDLPRLKNSRNFWVSVAGHEPWSATGLSAAQAAKQWQDPEDAVLTAGIGWFSVARSHKKLKLKATVMSFVPASADMVELMKVTLENTGRKCVRLTPTFAMPLFGRSADNLRDHRTVTTMFNHVAVQRHGVILKPSIHHDERGHTPNATHYAVLGATGGGAAPKEIWANMRDFLGEGGQLDNPEAVFQNRPAPKKSLKDLQGQEVVGAMRFAPVTLAPGQSASYLIILGITDDPKQIGDWLKKFGRGPAVDKALEQTKNFWRNLSAKVSFETDEADYGNWMRWVATQPIYRKVYGNSYLLDFGYGRGGRGWRDLWSDLLAIFLVDPAAGRDEIVNNFLGVRVDGTNATIIGARPGEFVADRNNIARTWCDHGTWPWYVLKFYLEQTGDFDLLFREVTYWKDQFTHRATQCDEQWSAAQGNRQQTAAGTEYRGSILEHVLLESLSGFYHVGEHNNLLLEGADWNDTYDGARQRGESVCFTSFYGWNLRSVADTLDLLQQTKGLRTVELLEEMLVLLDRLPGQSGVNYESWQAKRQRLKTYFTAVQHRLSGQRVKVRVADLAADLRAKADFIDQQVGNREWLTTRDGESFFNGHYDNDAARVHGDHPRGVRMDLTSQVFPVLCGVATDAQVAKTYQAVSRYLRDRKLGGLHLCTNLHELKLNLGRVAGFVYGYKEHGGIWNQMNVMFMYALYTRNFVPEGYRVFREISRLCLDSKVARIFPAIPSFFGPQGRGSYNYLTGSATWLVVATLTQMFGIRGVAGDLCLEPKLVREQFGKSGRSRAACDFGGKRLRVTYANDHRLEWGRYRITAVQINGAPVPFQQTAPAKIIIHRNELLSRCQRTVNEIEVTLG